MSFTLKQSGSVRRPGLEISVSDLKEKAAAGVSFWRGLIIGLLTGLLLSYVAMSGLILRLWQ